MDVHILFLRQILQDNRMSVYFLNSTFDLQAKEQEIILAMKI